ncbi:MAG: DUF1552 domain-containing protein [Myxococcota bacterium]|nr:DUF1552 domain-containing protein [Myxococcota bacterium]
MITRRSFLRGLSATAVMGHWLTSAESRAQTGARPLRLMMMHRPNGTIASDWLPNGSIGPILQGFDGVGGVMAPLRGLRIVAEPHGTGTHEGALVTLMTGRSVGETRATSNDDWRNSAASLDQIFCQSSPLLGGTPTPSLQLAAHNRQDGNPEVANCTLSYAGPDQPLYPEVDTEQVYARLFSGIMPGGGTTAEQEAALRARARRASVLDFVTGDLTRLRALMPAAERDVLDAHTEAVRALETSLDAGNDPVDPVCTSPGSASGFRDNDEHVDVARIGARQLDLVRAAFQCDLTRTVTYMWSTSASRVNFTDLYSGMGRVSHHSLSHGDLSSAAVNRPLAAIDRWYADRTAEFLRNLESAPDIGGGNLLERTIVVYFSEVAAGNHTFSDLPVVLFGGSQTGLRTGAVADVRGRTTNELWLTLAQRFQVPNLTTLGTSAQASGPIPGLFA